jgi:hypothetical protein
MALESLEGRVVLSPFGDLGGPGSGLAASLTQVGVITSPVSPGGLAIPQLGWVTTQDSQISQLQKDEQTLRTELTSLGTTSGVTLADDANLAADDQAIALGGAWLDSQSAQKALGEIAVAVTTGGSAAQVRADFAGLFANSSVTQATIEKAYADVVQTIGGSKVTAADLQAVAADQQAVQTDLKSLFGASGAGNVLVGAAGAGGGQALFSGSSVAGFGPLAGAGGGQASVNGSSVAGFGPLGGTLAASLSSLGVATSPNSEGGPMIESGLGFGPRIAEGLVQGGLVGSHRLWMGGNTTDQGSQVSQIQTDQQALSTELKGLVNKSGVTVADLTNLDTDSSAIAQAGVFLGGSSLQNVTRELVTAVAGGADTTQAKTDFNALFTSSSATQATIDKAFSDMVQTIADSKVTAADLQAVAADQQAIQTDLTNLHANVMSGGAVGATTTSTSTSSTTSSSSGSPSSTGGGTTTAAAASLTATTTTAATTSASHAAGHRVPRRIVHHHGRR